MTIEEDYIYNRNGEAEYRVLPRGIISDYMGNCVAYIRKTSFNTCIYDYNGNQIAWFEKGALRDKEGYLVGFSDNNLTEKNYNMPMLPYKKLKSNRNVFDKIEPNRKIAQPCQIRPMPKNIWSKKSLKEILEG